MPRRSRCLLPGVPCHLTQRGVDRCAVFLSDRDRFTYLRLLRQNLQDAQVHIVGWCLMPNHVHLIAVPEREDSLSVLLRRVHGRYAQYFNTHAARSGHLWQNRFFGCVLGEEHLWTALAYVDRNPVRAGMVQHASQYGWSSAVAHISGTDDSGLLDLDWWRQQERGKNWAEEVAVEEPDATATLRRCTYSGRPFAGDGLVKEISQRFGRYWTRGRPRRELTVAVTVGEADRQLGLF